MEDRRDPVAFASYKRLRAAKYVVVGLVLDARPLNRAASISENALERRTAVEQLAVDTPRRETMLPTGVCDVHQSVGNFVPTELLQRSLSKDTQNLHILGRS